MRGATCSSDLRYQPAVPPAHLQVRLALLVNLHPHATDVQLLLHLQPPTQAWDEDILLLMKGGTTYSLRKESR